MMTRYCLKMKYALSQSKADELVPTGFQEVLDVLLPVNTQTGCSQISDSSKSVCCHNSGSEQTANQLIFTHTHSFSQISSVTLCAAAQFLLISPLCCSTEQ